MIYDEIDGVAYSAPARSADMGASHRQTARGTMTEHEMADWWENAAGLFEVLTPLGKSYAEKARETAAMLRRVPTRAQRIEALDYIGSRKGKDHARCLLASTTRRTHEAPRP